MEQENPIKIPNADQIGGTHPVVIIGPNGSGKTKFGAQLANTNNADLIGAIRNIQLNDNISMRSFTQATNELKSFLDRRRSRYWEMSSEIDQLFSKLLAEDSQSAIKFRGEFLTNSKATPEKTKIMILSEAWTELFPGRVIDFSTYSPKVRANLVGVNTEYLAQQMSDGERVAVYLAGRVLDCDRRIIIVDEPEVHFHSQLAVKFWNKLEDLRPDCRFIYITHDLTFALSRRNAQYMIIQPNKKPELVPLDSELPQSVMQSILSAASFSIFARHIVFCEGEDKNKHDCSFYSSWFNDTNTAVIPVGNCSEVVQCTIAFGNSKIVSGVSSLGIIDRDYWPDDYFSSLPDEVHPLPVHEIENLYCIRGVFEAVGNHLSLSSQDINDKYNEFLQKAKSLFTGGLLCKQVSERFKKRYERQSFTVLNTLQMSDDLSQLQTQYSKVMKSDNRSLDCGTIFAEESKRIQEALASEENIFLKFLPGKSFYSIAADMLGITVYRYKELIHSALSSKEGSELWELGQSIEKALVSLLPSRNFTK